MKHKISTLMRILTFSFMVAITIACPPPHQDKKKVVVIMCDITSSLYESESFEVGDLAATILDRLPRNAEYILYPVQIETERPQSIENSNRFKITDDDYDVSPKENPERRKRLISEVNNLYKTINKKQPKDRTCLLNSLSLSKSFFSDFDSNKYEFELIFISDMIEQCSNISGIQNDSIDLEMQTPENALNLIQNAPFPDLSNVRITVIIPGSQDRMITRTKNIPTIETLRKFWSEVFGKCKNELATRDEWYRNEVPIRISESQTKRAKQD